MGVNIDYLTNKLEALHSILDTAKNKQAYACCFFFFSFGWFMLLVD